MPTRWTSIIKPQAICAYKPIVTVIGRDQAEQQLLPAGNQNIKKFKQLLEVHHQHIHRNGRTLNGHQPLAD